MQRGQAGLGLHGGITPPAKLCVNGHLSNAFHIRNGTQQGCALSPMLFVLTLEQLLRCIRDNSDVKGFTVKDLPYKLAAFTDDILLFLTEPHTALPTLLKDFELNQFISNFKINFDKSHALNVILPSMVVSQCKNIFLFKWQTDSII